MQSKSRTSGFTLIELLTVIAIIAILAAILFPVIAAVREQARQGSCMSNLHQIYVAAQVYRQDEGAFPPVLLGYAENAQGPPCDPRISTGLPFDTVGNGCVASADRLLYGFLYREQSRDINTFKCPDNVGRRLTDVTIAHFPPRVANTWPPNYQPSNSIREYVGDSRNITVHCPTDAAGYIDCYRPPEVPLSSPLLGRPKYFYIWDSYDIGPRIGPNGQVVLIGGQRVYDRHYSPDWTGYDDVNGYIGLSDMPNQLKWDKPPSDRTILTYCSWHVAVAGSSSVPAINMAGTARKLDSREIYNHGANIFNK